MNAHPGKVGPTTIPNEVLDTSSAHAASRWDELLRLQVDVLFQHELDYLVGSESWTAASSVLDVGCGNGYYLARLLTFFPAKRYSGVDVSEELIAAALHRHGQQIAFSHGDYFQIPSPARFDAILMRFIVQHLTGLNPLLDKAAELLNPGGSLFIVEPELSRAHNLPETPMFMAMLAAFEAHATSHGRMRAQLSNMSSLMGQAAGWSIAGDDHISVPRIGPFVGDPLLKLFAKWIDLCEHAAAFPFGYEAVKREIQEWAERPAVFSRIGLRILRLQYEAG